MLYFAIIIIENKVVNSGNEGMLTNCNFLLYISNV